MLAPWRESYGKPRPCIKKQRHHFAAKGPSSQRCGFSSSHVWMWELDHKEGWELKNWCFWTVVLEKTLESPLNCKEIKPAKPKGNKIWIFIGRTDAEAEAVATVATWCKGLTCWKRPWSWDKLKAKGEGSSRGWDGETASSTQWTWIWVNSGRRWRTGKPGMLQSMGWQRVRHNLVTEHTHTRSVSGRWSKAW